ncbi:MAG: hypothetical protein KGL39_06600 [Patescibacteria group bacterium]|nr:hypothetical protein [Patescibacteria group bacterium]
MDKRLMDQAKQHWIDIIAAALDQQGNLANRVLTAVQTQPFNAAGLAIKSGGGSPDFLTANTVKYMIGGKFYSVAAAADNAFSSTTHIATGFKAIFLVQVDASGTITTVQGTAVATSGAAVIPACVAGKCPLGIIQVANATGVDFVPGTTNLDAGSVTTTYVDFAGVVILPTLVAYPALPLSTDTSCSTLDTNVPTATPFAVALPG